MITLFVGQDADQRILFFPFRFGQLGFHQEPKTLKRIGIGGSETDVDGVCSAFLNRIQFKGQRIMLFPPFDRGGTIGIANAFLPIATR